MNVREDELGGVSPPQAGTRGRWDQVTSERAALIVFVVILVVAVPVVLFGVGSYHWFFRDDFYFLSGRDASSLDIFRPHAGHWTTVPVLAFRALWSVFGLHSYVPYQAWVLALHLGTCALLRVIMRRVGVGPWIATAAAASFVLFGPGEQNIIWAFQIGFTGSLFFGLAQVVLADHDGPVSRRDALALAAGALALMSSGVGVAMVVVVGMAMFGRRGYRVAALQTAPLAALYFVWWLAEHPELTSPFGRPTVSVLFEWLWNGEIGIFVGLGYFELVAALLTAVLVVGLVLAWSKLTLVELRRRASVPLAMAIGAVVFSGSAAMGRWLSGSEFARSSRYVHIGAALTLPLLAVAIDALARRWRVVGVFAIALLLVAIPWNATSFGEDSVFGSGYMTAYERILTNVVRVPEATRVPRGVRPIPDVYVGPDLTIGFLLDAVENGKLDPATGPMRPAFENQLRVMLGVWQRSRGAPTACREVHGPMDVSPVKGTTYGITQPLTVTTRDGTRPTSDPVTFLPGNGASLTVELAGLDLRFAPAPGQTFFTLCSLAYGAEAREVRNQLILELGVAQERNGTPTQCREHRRPVDVDAAKGTTYGITAPLTLALREPDSRRVSKPVVFDPKGGDRLTVRFDGLRLRFAAPAGAGTFTLCSIR